VGAGFGDSHLALDHERERGQDVGAGPRGTLGGSAAPDALRTAGDRHVLRIFVDGDGCPVKEEVYRVAKRYGLEVFLVANSRMRTPEGDWLKPIVVEGNPNAADDWIVEHVEKNDIVVTGDIPLASRCIQKEARVLGLKGRPFTEDNIGGVLATRDLLSELREQGARTSGPSAFAKQDRSRFLQQLDAMVHASRRAAE
jgi:uncharacterized protein YaiI (UPF0178 family)